jgi:hypothetical protein
MINQDIQSRVDAFRGNPDALAQRYQQSQQLIDLLALQKIKSEKEAAARQMQMQMAQQQAKEGQPPTIAEQREQEVLDLTKNEVQQQQSALRAQQQQQQQAAMQKLLSGIAAAPGAMSAAQPQAMAAGGIVAFTGGGAVKAAEERLSQAQQALQKYGGAQRRMDPKGYKAAQQEVEAARAELMRVTASQAQAAAGLGAARGLGMLRGMQGIQPPATTPPLLPPHPRRLVPIWPNAADKNCPPHLLLPPRLQLPRPAPRPAAPPAGIATTAPPAAQPSVELATPDMVQGTRDVTTSALGQNPEKIRKDRAAEAEAAARYTPEELAEKRSRIAELQALQPSEQALRDRRLIAGLLGAQSGYGIGSTLGAFGRASVSEGERQEAAQRANVLERQKMLDQLLEAGVAARVKGFEAGTAAEKDVFGRKEKAAGNVTQLQVAQQRALDSRLDRESRERLAREANAIRQEANRIQAESTKGGRSERLEATRQRLIVSIAGLEEKLLAAVKAAPIPLDIMPIQNKIAKGEKLSAGEQNAYNSFKDSQKLATAGARDRANELREELGLPPVLPPLHPLMIPKAFRLLIHPPLSNELSHADLLCPCS